MVMGRRRSLRTIVVRKKEGDVDAQVYAHGGIQYVPEKAGYGSALKGACRPGGSHRQNGGEGRQHVLRAAGRAGGRYGRGACR